MKFAILGPLRAVGPEGAIELDAPKQRAVLATLLLAGPGRAVSADRLIDVLWGEDPPPTSAKALQVHVSKLRRALGPGQPITTRPGGYALEREHGELDLERFEALVAQARREPPAEAARLLREALALFRGPPLADVPLRGPVALEPDRLARPAARPRWRSAWRPTCASAATAPSSPSSRRSPPSTPTASGCTRS